MFENFVANFKETQWIVMTVLFLYTWFNNKQSASAKEMLDIRLRVTELESIVKDMPDKIEIARLEGQIETVKSQLNSANSNIEKVHVGVRRIEDWLIANKK